MCTYIYIHTNIGKPRECLLLLVPSFLYLLQNNLLFIAVANLEAAVYQVLAQLPLLSPCAPPQNQNLCLSFFPHIHVHNLTPAGIGENGIRC